MADCEFCKLLQDDTRYFKVADDSYFLAFLDTRPLEEGHTLVIPKKHFDTVWDMPDSGSYSIGDYFKFSKKVAKQLKNGLGPREPVYALIMGLKVQHACIHLVPKAHHGFALVLGNFLDSKQNPPNNTNRVDSNKAYPTLKRLGAVQ